MPQSSSVLSTEERFRQLLRAKQAKARQNLLRQAYEPIYRRYRAVTPSLFARNGELHAYDALVDEATITASLKAPAVFTLDTSARLRWGLTLVNAPNVCAYLRDADSLEELARQGLARPQPADPFIYAPPFKTGTRLFAVITPELPPHETLPSGHQVVTTDFLVREYLGTIGLRLDLFTLLDAYLERPPEGLAAPGQE